MIRCICGAMYWAELNAYTLTRACKACRPKSWVRKNMSGIDWKYYPKLKQAIANDR